MRVHKLVLATTLLTAAAPGPSQTPAEISDIIRPDISRMSQVVDSFATSKVFMGAVLVAQGDQVLLSRAYGSADLEWDTPNTVDTKFRLGTLTNQFTAASILLLVEKGKVSLDAPIKTYCPEAPAAWDTITIRMLLSHTSGVPNFTNFPDYPATHREPNTPAQLIARFRDKPLDFAPSSSWNYSNSGYDLLGYVIEKTSGESYKDFVAKHLLKPLGMTNTGYDDTKAILPLRAHGYAPSKTAINHAEYVDMSIPYAAGGLYSTTGDLLKWELALFGGKVLQPAFFTLMTTPVTKYYGFGISIHEKFGHKVMMHSGGIDGFNTALQYVPDGRFTVVVLANLNGIAPDQIADDLVALALGQKVTLATDRK